MNEIESRKALSDLVGFDINKVMSYAQRYPEDFRGLKGYLTHGQEYLPIGDETKYLEMASLYQSLDREAKSTFLKCNNGLVKSNMVLDQERRSSKLPPAFDKSLAADHNYESIANLLSMSDIPNTCCFQFIKYIQSLYRKAVLRIPEEQIIKLTNGSSTRIVNNGININDILSIAFADPDIVALFPETIKFFHITNFEYEYLEVSDHGQGGDHMLIADKEYKTREVYRMTSTVQVISKAVHILLDSIARKIPGNYTYNHTGFLKKSIEMGRNLKGNLVSTDMSKYSDTLDRRLIMGILEKMGLPREVVQELDVLYSLPIKDKHTTRIFSGTAATYQGQYGDFPMITIANLYLQCCVRDRLGRHSLMEMYEDNAAVGDDTCFYFSDGDPNMQLETIIDIYGKAGVNINRTKTHILVDGIGSIDFVKRVVDKDGIIPYWIPNLLVSKERSDEGVREVYRYYDETGDRSLCLKVLNRVCGWSIEESNRIMNLHRINGGIREDNITEEDLMTYMARVIDLDYSTRLSDNGSKRWLSNFKENLVEQGLNLFNTPFMAYYSHYESMEEETSIYATPESIDQDIYNNITNMSRIGFKVQEVDIKEWLGKTWNDVKESDMLQDYMTSFRFKEDQRNMDNVYQDILSKTPRDIDTLHMYGQEISSLEDYIIESNRLESFHLITNKLKCKVYWETYFGYTYVYTYMGGRKVRLYRVEYQSNYDLPTNQELSEMGLSTREIDVLRRTMPSRVDCYSFWKGLF